MTARDKHSPGRASRDARDGARKWWARKWIRALENLGKGYANRLPRGRSYAKSGSVVEFTLKAGAVEARVLGTFYPFYDVHVKLPAIPAPKWDAILGDLAEDPYSATLLAYGIMPGHVDTFFRDHHHSLFPKDLGEIANHCTCPDYEERSRKSPHFVCKHIAAVHYVLADMFDADPFILFEIRGMSRAKVLAHPAFAPYAPEVGGSGHGRTSPDVVGHPVTQLDPAAFFTSPSRRRGTFHFDPPAERALLFEHELPSALENPAYFKRVLSGAIKKASAWAYRTATEDSADT